MNDRRAKGLLGGLTLAALLPFLNKAYDIDDPLFLWMGKQITRHPFDPYGGIVNWASLAQPMWVAMQNPPLSSYYIAVIGSVAGFGEVAMHTGFLLPAIAAVLGTFALAKRFCGSPLTAGFLTLFTPVFLISASHVMCDVMLLAFWTWAIHFWIAGLERGKWPFFLVSALLVTGATLTKYFGLSLVPLLLAYALMRERRIRLHMSYLTIPLLVALGLELITRAKYGHALFSSAMLYLRDVAVEVRIPIQIKLLTGCAFVGGSMVGAMFLTSFRSGKTVLRGIGFLLLIGTLFWTCVPIAAHLEVNELVVRLQGCLFATIGVALLALAVWDFRINQDADLSPAAALDGWNFCVCHIAQLVNHSSNDFADDTGRLHSSHAILGSCRRSQIGKRMEAGMGWRGRCYLPYRCDCRLQGGRGVASWSAVFPKAIR